MIRKTKIEDIKNIRDLLKSETGMWDENWRKDVLELAIKSAEGLTFVFVEDGKIIGFVCAHDVGFRSYLSILVVDANFRNRCIGKKLVLKVERVLRARGCGILIADVWKNSIQFYEKLGWSEPDVKLLRVRL